MKRTVMIAVLAMSMVFAVAKQSCAAGGGTVINDLRRQLYELAAYGEVTKMEVVLFNQDGSWHANKAVAFAENGTATLEMDVSAGPGNYRGYAYWVDKWSDPLFCSSDGKLSTFRPGMNLKDFPVYLMDPDDPPPDRRAECW